MRDTVYAEYQQKPHYSNASGVQAGCPDCHVPKPFIPRLVDQYEALGELYHSYKGTIDTPEKFEAHRLTMAQNEWARMTRTDSRECRNCHNYDSFDYGEQGRRSAAMHQKGLSEGQTCIDCHKGIAHKLPAVEQGVGAEKHGATAEEFHAQLESALGQPGPRLIEAKVTDSIAPFVAMIRGAR